MLDNVVVVGDGPAGLAAAAACAEAGLPVTLVGPAPGRVWRATYGAWADELPADALGPLPARRYERPLLVTGRLGAFPLLRPYAVLDNAGVQARLRERLAAAGGTEVSGVARGVTHDPAGSAVELADGEALRAGVVIDASGHRPALAVPGRGPAPAWQVAHGVIGRFEPPVVPDGGMWFMDWRDPDAGRTAAGPTFSYALDLGHGRALVEETSLAARPARPVAALRARLRRRLRDAGVAVREEGVEVVRFPMGGPVPPTDQRVVAYGAAAGMVHPATGYHVATALRHAPALARLLAAALAAPGATPADVAAAGWRAVWPADRLRERALHRFGLEVLLGFGAGDLERFFETFFTLPTRQWSAYVSGGASPETARAMLAVAARLPPRQRGRLAARASGREGFALVRALAGGSRPFGLGRRGGAA